MADQMKKLESKISVARKELNNLRKEIMAIKRCFAKNVKELEETLENDKHRSFNAQEKKVTPSGMSNMQQDTSTILLPSLHMRPIGFIESCFKEKNGIPRQPSVCPASRGKLCVSVDGFTNPEHSLEGLAEFSHVWVIFVFHKNTNKTVKAKVKPPRLDGAKVGVFASRSPHRPNPIGLTLARLDSINGGVLFLSGIDLLDGTPVLDIKPYVPNYDKPLRKENGLNEKSKEMKLLSLENPHCTSSRVGSTSSLIDQQGTTFSQDVIFSYLKTGTADLRVAEWVEKPPTKELNVEFTSEAEDQINCFHGSLRSECRSLSVGEVGDLSIFSVSGSHGKCSCFDVTREYSQFASPSSRESNFTKPIVGQSKRIKREKREPALETTEMEAIASNRKECLIAECCKFDSSDQSVLVSSDFGASFQDHVCETMDCQIGVSTKEVLNETCSHPQSEGALQGTSNFDYGGCVQSTVSRSTGPFNDESSHIPSLSPDSCIYQLEMLPSPKEARKAIIDILSADPRSVYRRRLCRGQLYRFSIDKMNVKCQFNETTARVLSVEPVYYREYNKKQEH